MGNNKITKTRMSAEERRMNILEAALKVVSESNYHEATTAKIAAEAGITEPIIYLHFKSKQELFVELLEDIRQFVLGKFIQFAAEKDDAISGLHFVLSVHYELVVEHANRYKVIILGAAVNDDEVKLKLVQISEDLRDFFIDQLSRAEEQGILRDEVDIEAVSLILVSWVGLLGIARVMDAQDTITRRDFDSLLDMMEKGFRK